MSLEFWLRAERFYEFWLVIIVSIIILLLIAMIFSYSYAQKKKRKKQMGAFLGAAVLLSSIGFIGHMRYAPYLNQAKHVNPLIRDRTPNFFDYTFFSLTEQSYYTGLNDLEALREMVLYEEEPITETLFYLGEGKHTHYFERDNGQTFRYNRHIEFIEDLEEAQLIGSRFFLKDDAFKNIGFKNPDHIMFDHIRVPASEKGKSFTPNNERDFLRLEHTLDGWNFNQ